MSEYSISKDLAEIAGEKFLNGSIDRRMFLKVAAALGIAPAIPGIAGEAEAAANELVICNYGGAAAEAFKTSFGAAFEKATGIKFVIDGSGPSTAKIRAMVQAKAVVWDVCDTATTATILLGKGGFLEPIDYSIVDKSKIIPGFAFEFGVANYTYSYVNAYNTDVIKDPPKSWADFFDVKKYPGMRTMSKMPGGQLESALLADGVPADKLFPLDVDRALKKIKAIRDHVIFWESGAQSQQLFRDKEVVMGNIWHTRAWLVKSEMKGALDWSWNQAILNASAWNIPKGNPAGAAAANKFVAMTQDPAQQAQLFKMMANGPVNVAASALVPDDMKKYDPGQPENMKAQIATNAEWWAANSDAVTDRWLDAISG